MIVTDSRKKLHLFQGFGVELEYMITQKDTLKVAPISDKLIFEVANAYQSEVELGDIAWSNELVLHVIELKTNGPSKDLSPLPLRFQAHINNINKILAPYNAMLLPSGAHPFMDPLQDTRIWPHEYNAVYDSYNRIFNCKGHGWSNVQSTHLNLPFQGELEFVQLHTAIRLLLPIIPALSASTPLLNGRKTGYVDSRLECYRKNQQKIPSITGVVIPEAIGSIDEYHDRILKKIYHDIAELDNEGILQEEWLNSRGAIARFDRDTIEIRIIDTQECAVADIAILQLISALLKKIIQEEWLGLNQQLQYHEFDLANIFLQVIRDGQNAVITDTHYLNAFGITSDSCSAKQIWQHLYLTVTEKLDYDNQVIIEQLLRHGNLAERIVQALGNHTTSENIITIYQSLGQCLQQGRLFIPPT